MFTDPMKWKSFGDASAVCTSMGAKLAAPENPDKLRDYLIEKKYGEFNYTLYYD